MAWRQRMTSGHPWIPEREGQMLSEEIDFHKIFKINPTAMALFTPDLEFIDANDAFLAAIGHPLEDLIGRHAFEIAPKMPADPSGNPKWTALEAALTTRHREVYQLERYDIEDPAHPGVFEERYWTSIVTPVLDVYGEVEVLEMSVREVTPIISQFQSLHDEGNAPGSAHHRGLTTPQVPPPRRPGPQSPAPRAAAHHGREPA